MAEKPTYEELEQRVRELGKKVIKCKKIEDALRESEEKFRAVLAAVPDLMIVLDAEGRYRDIFTAAPDLLIAPADQLLGKTIHEVMPEKDAQQIQNVINQTLSTGKLQQIEYVLDIDGVNMSFAGRVAKLKFQNTECVLWSARDITERKKAEKALRESEKRFRTLLEKSVETIFVLNFNMEFVFWNRAAEEMIGLTMTPTQKPTLFDVLTPDSLKVAKTNVAHAAQTGFTQPRPYELTIRKSDGPLVDVEVFIGLVEYKGKPHMLGTARDITKRKRAERELQKRMNELETFYRATLGREERIIELKQEVNESLEQLGNKKKYGDYN